jgi:hypothetical protein
VACGGFKSVMQDGRKVINVGATPHGSVAIIEVNAGELTARLERFRGHAPLEPVR